MQLGHVLLGDPLRAVALQPVLLNEQPLHLHGREAAWIGLRRVVPSAHEVGGATLRFLQDLVRIRLLDRLAQDLAEFRRRPDALRLVEVCEGVAVVCRSDLVVRLVEW